MSRKRPDSPSKVKVASCLTDSNIAVTSNSFMHVYVRLANFNSQASFPKCKPVTISSVYSQRSKVEKIPTQKQRELVKVLQGISYKRGLVVNFVLMMPSCIRPIVGSRIWN